MSEKILYNSFYGDEVRWFIGIVEATNDPLRLGRVRVRIYGIHSFDVNEVPRHALPWAQVVAPITHAGTSGQGGTPTGLKPTAQVFGIFLDGKHSQLPLILGSIPKMDGPNPMVAGLVSAGASGGAAAGSGTVSAGQPPATTGDTVHFGGGRPASQIKVEGGSNMEKAFNMLNDIFYNDFKMKSNSKEYAAGFVGNLMVESFEAIDPLAYNSDGAGFGANGIAQWRADRYLNLKKFAAGQGVGLVKNAGGNLVPPDLKTQILFIAHELRTGHGGVSFSKWNNAGTASKAAELMEKYYERSGGSNLELRKNHAVSVYELFAHTVDKDPSPEPPNTSSNSFTSNIQ